MHHPAKPSEEESVAGFIIDPRSGEVFASAGLSRLLGPHADEVCHYEDWLIQIVHQGDQQAMRQALQAALKGRAVLRQDFRVTDAQGRTRLLRARGDRVRLPGRGDVLSGSVFDRTQAFERERHDRQMLNWLRALLDASPDLLSLKDGEGRYLLLNRSAQGFTGFCPEQFHLRRQEELARLMPAAQQRFFAHGAQADATAWRDGSVRYETAMLDSEGRTRRLDVVKVAVYDPQGQRSALLTSARDVTAQREAERALRENEAMLRSLIDASPDFIAVKDGEGRWRLVNEAGQRLYHIVGQHWQNRTDAEIAQMTLPMYADGLRACTASDNLTWNTRTMSRGIEEVPLPEGGKRVFDVIKHPTFDEEGQRKLLVIVGRDITERIEAEQQYRNLAFHDSLTGLLNRLQFLETLRKSIARASRHRERLAVMLLDLDHFKAVNDTQGHQKGDRLLQQMADRLRSVVRVQDAVARLGGDEFILLLDGIDTPEDAAHVARRVLDVAQQPFDLGGTRAWVSASVGISLFPDDALTEDGLMRDADAAMYRAKDLSRNTFQFYTEELGRSASQRLSLLSALRGALQAHEFSLVFQPQQDVQSLRALSVEALLRWNRPQQAEAVGPEVFVPLLEESGLIVPVGQWVLENACTQARRWIDATGSAVRIAVNISAVQLHAVNLALDVAQVLERTGLPADRLELEITETALMRDPEAAARALRDLKAIGLSLTLDDFGTGYSSLSYLKRFPIDRIKIDQSFVRDIASDPGDLAIVRAIIAMGHSLGLDVVAEGVETPEQRDLLERLGCDVLQGYLIGRPDKPDKVATLLDQGLL
ncbi:MAG: EAL domain-containing protein [Halothiobacillaceae bacterium]|nr:EAL domain-containing protein [Halothiobacillaceae bacterium]